jgi:hypothetical protein
VNQTDENGYARMASLWSVPGMVALGSLGGESPTDLWRYVVDVRSLGANPIDSLAQLAGMDVGREIMPHLAPTMTVGYAGIDFLERQYGFSHTGFNLVAAIPLVDAPEGFDTTMRRFLSRITSLVYEQDTTPRTGPYGSVQLWVARDTSTNDTMLLERKLQPSFAVIGSGTLVIASTPSMLNAAVDALSRRRGAGPQTGQTYMAGAIRIDSMAANASNYLKRYLLRTDRFAPDEVSARLGPLQHALSLYDRVEWNFREVDGLRQGSGILAAAR